MRFVTQRVMTHGPTQQRLGILRTSSFDSQSAQVGQREGRLRVHLQSTRPESLEIAVVRGLEKREHGQDQDEHTARNLPRPLVSRQPGLHEDQTRRQKDDQTHAGVILKVIRDVGVSERVDVKEPEGGDQAPTKDQECRKRPAADLSSSQPKDRQHDDHGDRKRHAPGDAATSQRG